MIRVWQGLPYKKDITDTLNGAEFADSVKSEKCSKPLKYFVYN